jgi:DNA modification methylase
VEVVNIDTSDLVAMAAPYNPRKISKHDLERLRTSMRTFGTVEPIVVNRTSGRIVGGHQRVAAASLEKLETLPVVYVDLDDAQEKQLNIALNRIHGEWDEARLAELLHDLELQGADLALTGFATDELAKLMFEVRGGKTDPDEIPAPPDVPSTRPGDLIVLGRHRLLCGDSSSRDDLARLLGGSTIQLVNTDPPYNVKVEPRSNNAIAMGSGTKGNVPNAQRDRMHHQGLDLARRPGASKPTGKMRAKDRALENDFVSDAAFDEMLIAWFGAISSSLEPGRSFYIWGGYSNIRNYPRALDASELFFSQAIIWDKKWPVLTRKDFMGAHEWCFYGWRKGAAHWFNPKIKNATDLWSVKKINPVSMVHLTGGPVELAELAMTYSSKIGENVLDLFGGSGSTMIAAERMDRCSFSMEIDPAYCDVIVTRWQNFTGKKAEGWRG